MACSASPKLIGTVDLMALFAYTLFAFAMALLALLAPLSLQRSQPFRSFA
jgi:hypothetical protein